MRDIVEIGASDATPEVGRIMETQGIPAAERLSQEARLLVGRSLEIFLEVARPVGLLSDISAAEFEAVYEGEGLNDEKTPVETIARKADDLGLFVATIGGGVSTEIDQLFKSGEFALGSMLDSAASAGVDRMAELLESLFFDRLLRRGRVASSTRVLRYSPGYCGWHVSGQKRIFDFLHPDEIGVSLLSSFLMKPLKSISGAIIAGDRAIHQIEANYPCCQECRLHSCRERAEER
jgi:hypothetical protein